MTVVLDPGHGGADKGAQYGQAKESDLVLNIAQKVKKLLNNDADFDVHLTRSEDLQLSLPSRVQKAENLNADLFVSLHANAAIDSRAQGAEFFFQNSVSPDEESLYLAHQENQLLQEQNRNTNQQVDPSKKADVVAILEDMQRQARLYNSLQLTQQLAQSWSDLSPRKTAIKQAPFYVISNTTMPSVLVEVGFLSNPKEARQLLRSEYQQELAQKIYKAIVGYKEKMDKVSNRTLD